MTRSPVEFKDSTMIVGLLQILNIHFDSPCDEYLLLWFMMVRSYKTAPVVQKVDNAIHRINHYPLDIAIGFAITYPVDSDLSGG